MATAPANQRPASLFAGSTSDPPYGPLANCGSGNPFFYQVFADDYNSFVVSQYVTGTGVTTTAGDGGLVTLATATVLQVATASFVLPTTGSNPPVSSTSSKKMFFLARLQLSNVSTVGFLAGFGAAGTAFAGTLTGQTGLFIGKAAGSTVVNIYNAAVAGNSPSGVAYNITVPLNTTLTNVSLVNNTNFDVAFEIDRSQNVYGYIGPQLVGYWPQHGRGTQIGGPGTFVAGTPDLPVRGRAGSNYNWMAQATGMAGNVATPWMFTQTPLAPLIAVSGGTGIVDFMGGMKER